LAKIFDMKRGGDRFQNSTAFDGFVLLRMQWPWSCTALNRLNLKVLLLYGVDFEYVCTSARMWIIWRFI